MNTVVILFAGLAVLQGMLSTDYIPLCKQKGRQLCQDTFSPKTAFDNWRKVWLTPPPPKYPLWHERIFTFTLTCSFSSRHFLFPFRSKMVLLPKLLETNFAHNTAWIIFACCTLRNEKFSVAVQASQLENILEELLAEAEKRDADKSEEAEKSANVLPMCDAVNSFRLFQKKTHLVLFCAWGVKLVDNCCRMGAQESSRLSFWVCSEREAGIYRFSIIQPQAAYIQNNVNKPPSCAIVSNRDFKKWKFSFFQRFLAKS